MIKTIICRHFLVCGVSLLWLTVMSFAALAETHIVEMRNSDANDASSINIFSPAVLKIAMGDSVKFKAVVLGHNSAAKKGMLPEGAKSWNGKIDEEIEVTFTVDGTYGYICLPHYGMGMVGLILVGDHTVNLQDARKVKQRGKAKKAFRTLFKQVDALEQKSELF